MSEHQFDCGISYVCTECGSDDVSMEAVCVYWMESEQAFEVSDLADKGHFCNTCDELCGLAIVPYDPEVEFGRRKQMKRLLVESKAPLNLKEGHALVAHEEQNQ